VQVDTRGASRVPFVGSPARRQSVIKALRVFPSFRVTAGLSVFLVNGRGAAVAVRLGPGVPARVLPFPVVPSFLFSLQDAFPLPLARLIPLPLEGRPPAVPSSLSAPVPAAAVARRFVVQLEGPRAASSPHALLGLAEVAMGSRR